MQDCLSDIHLHICCIFIDDVIVFSRTYEEHVERLKLVFDVIKEHNLKLSPGTCSFVMPKVKYVGRIVSEAGIETDPEKIEKNCELAKTTNSRRYKEIYRFCRILQTLYKKLQSNFKGSY